MYVFVLSAFTVNLCCVFLWLIYARKLLATLTLQWVEIWTWSKLIMDLIYHLSILVTRVIICMHQYDVSHLWATSCMSLLLLLMMYLSWCGKPSLKHHLKDICWKSLGFKYLWMFSSSVEMSKKNQNVIYV